MATVRFLNCLERSRWAGLGLGYQQETGRVLVEAVNNARPGRVADLRQPGKIVEESVGEGACLVARARVGCEAGLLVDGEQVVVFVKDIE